MKSKITSKFAIIASVILVIILASMGGIGIVMAQDGSGEVISACYQKNNGQLRLVDDCSECRNSEIPITWNQQGIQGEQGPQGETGPVGPQGLVGPQGPIGLTGDTGPQGAVGPAGADGADGADGLDGAIGPKGDKGDQGEPGLLDLADAAFINSTNSEISIGMDNSGTPAAQVTMFDSSSFGSGTSYYLTNTYTFDVTVVETGYLNQFSFWGGNNQNPFGAHLVIKRGSETILDQNFTGLTQVYNSWDVRMNFATSILVNQGDTLTISFTPSMGIGIEPVFTNVPGMTKGTISGYGDYFIRVKLLASMSIPPFQPRIVITEDGDLIIKDFIRANKTNAEAKGPGTIYIENGFLKIVP